MQKYLPFLCLSKFFENFWLQHKSYGLWEAHPDVPTLYLPLSSVTLVAYMLSFANEL